MEQGKFQFTLQEMPQGRFLILRRAQQMVAAGKIAPIQRRAGAEQKLLIHGGQKPTNLRPHTGARLRQQKQAVTLQILSAITLCDGTHFFQLFRRGGKLPLSQRHTGLLQRDKTAQQGEFMVKNPVGTAIIFQKFCCLLQFFPVECCPGLRHHRLIGGENRVFFQKPADVLAQPRGEIGKGRHRRACCAVFDLGEHIAGHFLAAQLPLRESRFQSCLFDFFAQCHGFSSG